MIDVAAMIRQGTTVSGAAALASLARLTQDLPTQPLVRKGLALDPDQPGVVWFELTGASQAGRRDKVWLKIQAVVMLTCQRCMGQMAWVVDETAAFVCYDDESKALAAVQDEEDPLAPEPLVVDELLDVLDLVQDQLILAVPYVPKHESCQPSAEMADAVHGDAVQDDLLQSSPQPSHHCRRESPFKVLEGLKIKAGKGD